MSLTKKQSRLFADSAEALRQGMIAKPSLADQIAQSLMSQISAGTLKEGEQLPAESDLCEMYGVSRVTVRRALDFLAKNNLITRIAGKGSFVSGKSDLIGWKWDNIQDLVKFTTDTKTDHPKVLKWAIVKPIDAARQFLNINSEKTYLLLQTRYVEGEPFYFVEVYIPLRYGRMITIEALKRHTPLELFEMHLNLPLQRVVEELSARPALKVCADPLNIKMGDPTVLQTLKFYGPDGPLQYVRVWWPARLFKRKNELVRK